MNVRALLGRVYDAVPGKRWAMHALRTIATVPEPVYRHLHFKGVFRVREVERPFRMYHHGGLVENEVFWRGLECGWEAASMKLWLELARGASCVVDVGANTGLFALAAAAVSPSADVVALEPVARVYERLKQNVSLNDFRIECVQAAASDRDGTADLYDAVGDHPLSSSLAAGFLTDGTSVAVTPVRTVALDGFLVASGRAPDLIKVDVEGHEAAVLRGLAATIERDRPTLLVEVLNDGAAREIGALLAAGGYTFWDVDERLGPRRIETLARGASNFNVLACTPETARRVGLPGIA